MIGNPQVTSLLDTQADTGFVGMITLKQKVRVLVWTVYRWHSLRSTGRFFSAA